jgi:hypothetical protein
LEVEVEVGMAKGRIYVDPPGIVSWHSHGLEVEMKMVKVPMGVEGVPQASVDQQDSLFWLEIDLVSWAFL